MLIKISKALSLLLLAGFFSQFFVFSGSSSSQKRPVGFISAAQADTSASEESDDYDRYVKYQKCLKYERRSNYRKYKEYKEKYAFDDEKEKAFYKDRYEKYKLYKKSKRRLRFESAC